MNSFRFKSAIWRWPGDSNIFFVSLDKKISEKIRSAYSCKVYGPGFIKINIKLKGFSWNTSLFYSKKEGVYFIPIKKKIRSSVGIFEKDIISFDFYII